MAAYIRNNKLNSLVPLTSQRLGFLTGTNVASAPDTAGGMTSNSIYITPLISGKITYHSLAILIVYHL